MYNKGNTRNTRRQANNLHIMPLFKEFSGKKYKYGGEYPNSPKLIRQMKRILNQNGYNVIFDKNGNDKVVIWSRRK